MPAGWRRRPRQNIGYADELEDTVSRPPPPLFDESYAEGPAPGLEGSKSSLGKRLASVAGLSDDSQPKDFTFLFHRAAGSDAGIAAGPEAKTPWGASGSPAAAEVAAAEGASPCWPRPRGAGANSQQAECPDVVEDDLYVWLRTDIRRAADLVDGQAWMAAFQERLAKAEDVVGTSPARASASPATRAMGTRNRVLKEMVRVCPPGRLVHLPNGQEVIFWFNVGAPGPLQKRVHVTESRCPHQGVCLLSGELGEIEDATGMASPVIRCPRHNKAFNLHTGESPGNAQAIRPFPCRFMHGCWYVGVDPEDPLAGSISAMEAQASPRLPSLRSCCPEQPDGGHGAAPPADPVRKRLCLSSAEVGEGVPGPSGSGPSVAVAG